MMQALPQEEQGGKGQSGSPVEEVKSCDASKENATKMETTEEIANKLKTTKEEAHKGVDKMQEEMTGTSMTKELETFNETNCNDSEEMDMNRCRGDTKDDINNGHKEGFTISPDQTLRERRFANANKKTAMANGLDEVDAKEALDREQKSVKDVAPEKKNSQGVQLLTYFEVRCHKTKKRKRPTLKRTHRRRRTFASTNTSLEAIALPWTFTAV